MACTSEFIEAIYIILSSLGEVRYRKMMGDYVIYFNDKYVAIACDDLLYVKKLSVIESLMTGSETGKPYDGAKEHYILELSNPTFVKTVISTLWEDLPFPKSKKK